MSLNKHLLVQEYLTNVCKKIKAKEVHNEVKMELTSHIEDIVAESTIEGMDEESAVKEALRKMGEAEPLGNELNHTYRCSYDWILISLVGILASAGLGILYSMGYLNLIPSSLFIKSCVYLLLGLILAVGISYFNYQKLQKLSMPLYWGTIAIWLLAFIFGDTFNGRSGFLNLGFLAINFTWVTLYLFAIALAGILTGSKKESGFCINNKSIKIQISIKKKLTSLLLYIIPTILYLRVPDIAAFITYTLIFMGLVLVNKLISWKTLLITGGGLLLLPISYLLSRPYGLQRLLTFLHPQQDPMGAGWIYLQSKEIIRMGGLWGKGFTFPKGFLPEIHTNFVFPYLIYTFGWVAAGLFVLLVTILIVRLIKISHYIPDQYGQSLVISFLSILSINFVWNFLMALGLAPITGFSMPFISYGGSQTICQMLAIGLILSVYKRKNIVKHGITH
jgi:rod shape determining protein RodA